MSAAAGLPISGIEALARSARLKASAQARRDCYPRVCCIYRGQYMEFMFRSLNEAAVLRQWALAAGASSVQVFA